MKNGECRIMSDKDWTKNLTFSVSILFTISPSDCMEKHSLWEDRILLIFADSQESARSQAEAIARKAEYDYESAEGRMLSVRFECVERVCEISEEFSNGCELFSRFLRDSEARSLLQPFDD